MGIHLKRRIYTGLMRMLPRNQRTSQHFYFVNFSVSAIVCLALTLPAFYYGDLLRPFWSSLVFISILLFLLVLWWRRVSLFWLQGAFHLSLLWIILYNAYYTGGITSPLMVWMGVVPILPLFTMSRRWASISLAISFIIVVCVYLLQIRGLIPNKIDVSSKDLTFSLLMNGLLCITLSLLVITYDTAQVQHIRIIERKNAALNQLSYNLQLASKHKDKFLATVSHEMRTPLNAMMGYLGLLKNLDNLTPSVSGYIDGAQNSASHLLTVINDLLDFSQIQKGKLVLSLQDTDLFQILREAHRVLEQKAISQGIKYQLLIDDNVPKWVRIDPHRFTQIALNLLGNALKFTLKGEVTTHVHFEKDHQKPEEGHLVMQFQDTGIGIPRSFFKHIFEPFSQLPVMQQSDSSLRGNGLGLSITKTLVTSMGGSLSLDSEEGIGSVFEVRLPVTVVAEPTNARTTPTELEHHDQQLCLLIVDDHATNRLVASATIKQDLPNAHIDQARNGAEAIEKMKVNRYDLVLMDMVMPDYSGTEVTRIIRNECQPPFSNVKVVALTASVAETLSKDCADVGISEILRKPFERNKLIRTILKHALS